MTNSVRLPLVISDDEWRCRWLVTGKDDRLHRIGTIGWEHGEKISGIGTAVCGIEGHFCMPGFFSRMHLQRCAECCTALDIPTGDGAPFNTLESEPWSNA